MSKPLVAHVAWEHASTRARLEQLAPRVGLEIGSAFAASDAPPELSDARLMFLEQSDLSAAVIARTQAFASAEEGLLVVVVVPEGTSAECEAAILEAGAFDVLELGERLPRRLRRVVHTAQRLDREERARSRLGADLAHGERLSAIGLLAAGVGHEINNPASVVLVAVENVRMEVEGLLSVPRFRQLDQLQRQAPQWIEDLGDCVAATRRISSIVKTLGVFSRKADDTPPVPVLLNDDVDTVVRLIGRELRYQAAVELDLDPELPRVLANQHALIQVVTNLVVNALQALEQTAASDARLRIRTSHDDSSVLLEVEDNGPGIPRESLPRIFDPFFTTKGSSVGSGLGLAITRELVNKAGGDVFVESEPGRGARFWVVLPRVPANTAEASPPQRLPPPLRTRLRVMIVDDDEFVLRAVARSLSDEFECITVSSGPEALAELRSDARVDALLADVVMPGMNGVELFEALRREHPALAERTVFFSGGIRSSGLRDALESTGRPCLEKPVARRELCRVLRADPPPIAPLPDPTSPELRPAPNRDAG